MKNIFRLLLTVAVLLVAGTVALAQNNPGDWRSRMRSERVAFLTTEMGLTPEEAQFFWPLYNQAEAEEAQAFEAVMKAFRDLDAAVRQKKSDSEIARLLKEYTSAVSIPQSIDAKYLSSYQKILPAEKVAKLFIAEEMFRNNQIHKLQRAAGAGMPRPSGAQPAFGHQQGGPRQNQQ